MADATQAAFVAAEIRLATLICHDLWPAATATQRGLLNLSTLVALGRRDLERARDDALTLITNVVRTG